MIELLPSAWHTGSPIQALVIILGTSNTYSRGQTQQTSLPLWGFNPGGGRWTINSNNKSDQVRR